MPKTAPLILGTLGLSLLLASCNSSTTAVTQAQPAQAHQKAASGPTTALKAQFAADKAATPQIVYGQVTARGARPYQVYLSIHTSEGNFMCGGSLISNNWVMTAAHCMEGATASNVTVRAGANDLSDSSQGQNIKAATLYVHPNYRGATGGSDIALIKLSSSVTSSYAAPIKLPSDSIESVLDVAGNRATVSGWGKTESGSTSSLLREVSLPITPNPATCGGDGAPENTICGEYDSGKDSCNGDSGGPLAQSYNGNFYELGIVSYGPTECRGNGIYTRVNAYLGWIKQVSGITPDSSAPTTPTTPPPTTPGTTTYSGSLSSGATGYAPNSNGFYYAGGTLKGTLSAAYGTDFDLYLEKQSGSTWQTVAYSENDQTSNESISYRASAGTYRWNIHAYSGSGKLQLVESK